MSGKTEIAWTEQTWNPVRGCRRVSPGCEHCYAESMAARLVRMGGYEWIDGEWRDDPTKKRNAGTRATADKYRDLVKLNKHGKAQWTGKFAFDAEALAEPLRRKTPTMYFVNSMSDVFGEGLTNEQIAAVFGVMAACPRHTFQVLTKRAERMAEWFRWIAGEGEELKASVGEEPHAATSATGSACVFHAGEDVLGARASIRAYESAPWPLPNVWLGVSVERQEEADARIPHLLRCPATVRWVSAEPLLGPLSLDEYLYQRESQYGGITTAPRDSVGVMDKLDWVVTGGESGQSARPCDVQWIRGIGRQCRSAGVAWFNKQLGSKPGEKSYEPGARIAGTNTDDPFLVRDKKGADPSEWPEDLRVREWPRGFTPPKSKSLPVVGDGHA